MRIRFTNACITHKKRRKHTKRWIGWVCMFLPVLSLMEYRLIHMTPYGSPFRTVFKLVSLLLGFTPMLGAVILGKCSKYESGTRPTQADLYFLDDKLVLVQEEGDGKKRRVLARYVKYATATKPVLTGTYLCIPTGTYDAFVYARQDCVDPATVPRGGHREPEIFNDILIYKEFADPAVWEEILRNVERCMHVTLRKET